jgi:hypothetical protein
MADLIDALDTLFSRIVYGDTVVKPLAGYYEHVFVYGSADDAPISLPVVLFEIGSAAGKLIRSGV